MPQADKSNLLANDSLFVLFIRNGLATRNPTSWHDYTLRYDTMPNGNHMHHHDLHGHKKWG
jgi:hypothetical protein